MVVVAYGHHVRCLSVSDLLLSSGDTVSLSTAFEDSKLIPSSYIRDLSTEFTLDGQVPERRRKRLFAQLELRRISPRPISILEFFRPLYMLKYPSVGLLAVSWCIGVAMPDIGISNIVPIAFGEVYGWNPREQGLSNTGFLMGCFIGEAFAGSVSDWVSRHAMSV